MTRTFVSAALAAAALLTAAPASAAEGDAWLVFVPYGDLDLTTQAGEQALERRLEEAARATCDTGSTLRERMMARACQASFDRAALPTIKQAWARRDARRSVVLASR